MFELSVERFVFQVSWLSRFSGGSVWSGDTGVNPAVISVVHAFAAGDSAIGPKRSTGHSRDEFLTEAVRTVWALWGVSGFGDVFGSR